MGGVTPLTELRGRTLFRKDFAVAKFGVDLDGTGGSLSGVRGSHPYFEDGGTGGSNLMAGLLLFNGNEAANAERDGEKSSFFDCEAAVPADGLKKEVIFPQLVVGRRGEINVGEGAASGTLNFSLSNSQK